jgi:hypothetical protein
METITDKSPIPGNNLRSAIELRISKEKQILRMFEANLGKKFSSAGLHVKFGPAFRTRVSDINKDRAASITIKNCTAPRAGGVEASVYWAERRDA